MASTINASSSGSGGLISTGDASGVLQLQNNGTVAVTVSNGFVGIGTASPTALLHAQSSSNRAYIQIQSTATTSGPEAGMQFICSNRNFYLFNNYDTQTLDTYDATGAAFVLRQGRAGYTTALQGGTPVAGTGITFPATQNASSNANTLDDYEEGTWTPTIAFGGGTTGQSYAYQTGSYTKIGNRVFISMYVNFSNKGSSTGTATITGLPFTSASTSALYNNAAIWVNTMTGLSGSIQAYNGPGTSTISELAYVGTGGQTIISNSNFTNGSDIMVNFSYRVA